MMESLPPDVVFRPMHAGDVGPALQIIRQVDEDDYQNARQTYHRGLEDQYVLTERQQVIGVTGARDAPDTNGTCWLSWTYLDEQHRGVGLGTSLLEQLLETLRQQDVRKLFVSTSDYFDVQRGQIYRDALEAYQRVGFLEELRHFDYYDRNEAQIVLGLRLQEAVSHDWVPPHETPAVLTEIDEISETDDAYYLDWTFNESEGATPEDLQAMLRKVERWKGRVVFVGVPSDAAWMQRLLATAGFREEGRLRDYYEDGLDEIHFRYDLN